MSLIHLQSLSEHFKILNRREGLRGAFRVAFTYVIPIGFIAFYPSPLFLRWFTSRLLSALDSSPSRIASGQRA